MRLKGASVILRNPDEKGRESKGGELGNLGEQRAHHEVFSYKEIASRRLRRTYGGPTRLRQLDRLTHCKQLQLFVCRYSVSELSRVC